MKKTKRSTRWVIKQKKSQSKTSKKKKSNAEQIILLQGRQKYAGIHLIAEFWHGKNIEDPKKIKKILVEAVKIAKSVPLNMVIHKFSPHGLTGVVLLKESHIAIHTWPEIGYIAIDIFTCGNSAKQEKALQYLKKEFKPKKLEIKRIRRGEIK